MSNSSRTLICYSGNTFLGALFAKIAKLWVSFEEFLRNFFKNSEIYPKLRKFSPKLIFFSKLRTQNAKTTKYEIYRCINPPTNREKKSLDSHRAYFLSHSRQRPYHVENTSSRPITEVKQRWARLVLGWVTAWEHRVLLSFSCIWSKWNISWDNYASGPIFQLRVWSNFFPIDLWSNSFLC